MKFGRILLFRGAYASAEPNTSSNYSAEYRISAIVFDRSRSRTAGAEEWFIFNQIGVPRQT